MDPGIIGALLLPILGAVPDAAIVIVAGAMGPDPQAQLDVGVGTLAGSTIMLLTIPWAVGLWLARCDVRHGEAVDSVLTRPWSITETGATVDDDTPITARIMVATSFGYLIVQGVAFKYAAHSSSHIPAAASLEKWFAFAGMVVCGLGLIGYCGYQLWSPNWQRKQMAAARREHSARQVIRRMQAQLSDLGSSAAVVDTETSRPLLQEPEPDMHAISNVWLKKAAAKKLSEAKPAVQVWSLRLILFVFLYTLLFSSPLPHCSLHMNSADHYSTHRTMRTMRKRSAPPTGSPFFCRPVACSPSVLVWYAHLF